MNRQLTLSQYRAIDLGILAAILFVSQSLISLVSTTLYADQLYIVSTVGPVVGLVMMRWGPWAAIHAVFGGLLYTFLSGGSWQHYLIYGLGNLAGLGCLGLFKLLGKEKIWSSGLLTLLYGLAVQLLMLLGRGLVALIMGYELGVCLGFVTTDALSILFTMVILWVTRQVPGLLEDQKHYLLRLQAEQRKDRSDPF